MGVIAFSLGALCGFMAGMLFAFYVMNRILQDLDRKNGNKNIHKKRLRVVRKSQGTHEEP